MSQSITAAQLKTISGAGARADLVAAIVRGWPAAVGKAKLTTRLRAAHFISQIMTETGGLRILEESGAYKAPRIMKIFGVGEHSAAITQSEAQRIAALPVAQRGPVLFNRVYGRGNPKKMREFNNTGPNDGWLYRGGGMMQATGKSNYAAMEKKTGLPLVAHPEMLHQPDSAFLAAYLEWAQDGRCNAAADADNVVTVRRIINGGENGLDECKAFLAKAKRVLADYGGAAAAAFADLSADDDAPAIADRANIPVLDAVAAPSADVDPVLLSAQTDLKAMNYNPGIPSGRWGGMTGGAIAGFINDRGKFATPPASEDDYHAIRESLLLEIARAKAERFTRPVTEARRTGDAATVAEVAPEVVPVKRNFIAAAWAFVVSIVTAIVNWFKDAFSEAWDFFTDHKDDIPTDSGFLHTAWEWVSGLPPVVWILAAAALFGFIALNARTSANKITESVSTGARQ